VVSRDLSTTLSSQRNKTGDDSCPSITDISPFNKAVNRVLLKSAIFTKTNYHGSKVTDTRLSSRPYFLGVWYWT